MSDALATTPAHVHVDRMPDGRLMLIAFSDEGLESQVLRLTTTEAAKLGQILIDAAWRVERFGR